MNPLREIDVYPTVAAGSRAESPVVDAYTPSTDTGMDADEVLLLQAYRLTRRVLNRGKVRPLEQIMLNAAANVFREIAELCGELAPPEKHQRGRHQLYLSRTEALGTVKSSASLKPETENAAPVGRVRQSSSRPAK